MRWSVARAKLRGGDEFIHLQRLRECIEIPLNFWLMCDGIYEGRKLNHGQVRKDTPVKCSILINRQTLQLFFDAA